VTATPYTDEIVADTYHWLVRWGLISSTADTADLVDNHLPATATASALTRPWSHTHQQHRSRPGVCLAGAWDYEVGMLDGASCPR
jgi:hypothetical protein